MTLRTDIVAEARAWLGTPFHHQARLKGVGVDCAGLVIGVGRTLGLMPLGFDVTGYPRVPDGADVQRLAAQHLRPISQQDLQPGDVVLIAFGPNPQHMGIVGNYLHGGLSLIHAVGDGGHDKVLETRLAFYSSMKFVAAFALPGVH